MSELPVGKLPAELLGRLLAGAPQSDPRIRLGPGIGHDCAIIEAGGSLWAIKSDPITFASVELGWYLVQVNANDIAASGAQPRWLVVTLLLPEGSATPGAVEAIFEQIYSACRQIGVSVIGGHSEVTYGLSRALAVGTMIGEITSGRPLLPQHIEPEDVLILAGQVPVEAGAILALELPDRLAQDFSPREIEKLAGALHDPGISVLSAARAAQAGGTVHAMHDPTEGGLYTGVWEMAIASGLRLEVDLSAAPVLPLAGRACRLLGIDPLGAIASGALLIAAPPQAGAGILRQLQAEGIQATSIGRFLPGEAGVVRRTPGADGSQAVPYPQRDELARLFATRA